jgi:hypothetical protein
MLARIRAGCLRQTKAPAPSRGAGAACQKACRVSRCGVPPQRHADREALVLIGRQSDTLRSGCGVLAM